MRHDLRMAGRAYRLRPVEESDADYIVQLRTNRPFLNAGATTADEQRAWLARYFEREHDFYFVIETSRDGACEGLVALYDIDVSTRTGEWGRWVLREGSNASVESALLVYRCAFGRLRLDNVRCRTLRDNVKVVAFHDSCGLHRASSPVTIKHDGQPRAGVEHRVSREEWPRVEAKLERLSARFAMGRQGSR